MKNVEDIYPLSPTQQGMLFHSLLAPHSGVYVEQLSAPLLADLHLPSFERAWRQVVERHPALRTAFLWESLDQPLQVVRRHLPLPLRLLDWRGVPPAEQPRRLSDLAREDRRRGFELTQAPLMRLLLVRLGEARYHFIWSSHHLLLDGWSLALVLKEVLERYEGERAGRAVRSGGARPYRDYIEWLGRQDVGAAEAYWRERLRGFTAPTQLGIDRVGDNGGARHQDGFDMQLVELTEEATERLRAMARQHQLTLNAVVQGAWALLLSRYSGESDVVFGVTVSGRPGALSGVEQMVGLFINTLPLRVRVGEARELIEWLREIHREQVEMQEYEYSPLVEVQGWSEVRRGEPLFETILAFDNYPLDQTLREGVEGVTISDATTVDWNNFPISVAGVPGPRLSIAIKYERKRFDAAPIARLCQQFVTLLRGMSEKQGATLGELQERLDEADREHRLRQERDYKDSLRRGLKSIRRRGVTGVKDS